MKRSITISKEVRVEAILPSDECQSCTPVFGETRLFIGKLNRDDLTGTIEAKVSCPPNFEKKIKRHIRIELPDLSVDSNTAVKNWPTRTVRCPRDK